MGLTRYQMVTENIEGYSDFDIDRNWYKHRKPGISAVIRCYGEERWIGPCIESCLPLYDEIVVTLTEVEGDRTRDIIQSFHSSKIKIYEYPFKLGKKFMRNPKHNLSPQHNCYSVHQFSYYTNWGLSKTTYSHVSARWDADHILRPEYSTQSFKDLILSKSNIRVRAFNVVTPDFTHLSKIEPFQTFHVRFAEVNPYLYFNGNSDSATYYGLPQLLFLKRWYEYPVQQTQCLFNRLLFKDYRVVDPIFFHTKYLKIIEKKFDINGKFHTGINPAAVKYNQACLLPGEKISVTIPDVVFKKPEDYLS
jgi:hypothetical protein